MSTVIVNIAGNTAGLTSALSAATSMLAAFHSSTTAAASGASHVGGAAAGASRQINNFNIVVNNSTNILNHFSGAAGGAGGAAGNFLSGFAAIGGLQKFTELLTGSRDALMKAEKSFKGLEAVATSVGVNIGDAMKVVKEVTKDGLMDNAAASKSLQNLLAYGFSLKEAETLMKRLKDSSAFNAQGTLSISEAVERATEGIKNENSALIDNAGVTKNASVMFEEYAGVHGTVATALDYSQKRAALLSGVIEATNGQVGNAAKFAEMLGGQTAAADAKMVAMKETLGQALTPAFQAWNSVMEATAQGITSVVKTIQNLGAGAAWTMTRLNIFMSFFKDFDTKRVRKELDAANKSMEDFLANQYKTNGANIAESGNKKYGKPKADAEDTVKEKYEKEKAKYDIAVAKAKEEREVKEKQLALEMATFKQQYEDKVITLEKFKKEAIRINGEIAALSAGFFDTIGNGLNKLLAIGYKPKDAELKVAITTNDGDKEQAKIKNKMDDLKVNGMKSSGGGRSGGGGAASADQVAQAKYDKEKTLRDLALEEQKSYNAQVISLNDFQFQKFKISAESYYGTLNKYLKSEFEQQQANTKEDIKALEVQKSKSKNAAERIKLETDIAQLNSKLLTDESQFKQKFDENTRALKAYNEELKKQKLFKDIEATRANKDTDLSLSQIQTSINRTMGGDVDLNDDKKIENARFEAAKQAIEARRRYILENEKENTQELINLDKEYEEAQRNHILNIAQINADAFLQSKQNYLDFMATSKSAVAGFFVEMNKNPKNFKEAMLDAFNSIHQKIMSMIAENYAKKLFDSESVKTPLNSFMNMMGFGGMQKQPDLKDDSIKSNNPEVAKMTTDLTSSITDKLSGMFDGVSSMFSSFFSGLGNALNSVFSSLASAGGGGSGGGLFSMIGGFFSGIPALATGTNYVPQDNMLAFLHKGEAVVPAAFNKDKFGMGGGMSIVNNFTMQQNQTRYSQNQQAALIQDHISRGVYNK